MFAWWWPAALGKTHKLPPALGPYVPGWGDLMTGQSRNDGVFVRLYYPTSLNKNEDHSNKWRSWLPDSNYINGFACVLGLWRILIHLLYRLVAGDAKIPAVVNGPLLRSEQLKVAVFSHGMGGTRFMYSALCCELAAHGYVVAAVEHRDESASSTWYLDEKTKKPIWFGFKHVRIGTSEHNKLRIQQLQQRANEAVKALDLLRDLNNGTARENIIGNDFDSTMFKGQLDVSTPIMIGHSFGGATTLLTLAQNPVFKAGIILDPWMFPIRTYEDSPLAISQPLLCINMQTFQIAPNLRELRRYTSGQQPGPRENYTIRNTTHENQCDSVHLIGYWLNMFIKTIHPDIATRINNAIIIRFLRQFGRLEVASSAENYLIEHDNYIINGLTVDDICNRVKKIPDQWLTLGQSGKIF